MNLKKLNLECSKMVNLSADKTSHLIKHTLATRLNLWSLIIYRTTGIGPYPPQII
jgi:hypothetical protein